MGTHAKARQIDTTDAVLTAQIPLYKDQIKVIQDRVWALLLKAGAPDDPGKDLHTRNIARAINHFSTNRLLWWYAGVPGSADEVLQKHLAFTLFVPAGRADKARAAVDALADVGLFKHGAEVITSQILDIIRPLVRFPAQKTERLAMALRRWAVELVPAIAERLDRRDQHPVADRAWIMANIKGYGPKAAAHFMRNTGIMFGTKALPIIDVHIIKLLKGLGYEMYGEDFTRHYDKHAKQFAALARDNDLPPLFLDAMAWCAYAKNWDMSKSDFDNFNPRGVEHARPMITSSEP